MKRNILEKEVLKTVLFFNLHNRPLNIKEIHQYLSIKTQENQVFLSTLELCRKNKLIEKNQFFVLKNYQNLFRIFKKKLEIKQNLLKKTNKFIWFIKLFPFVRGVFLANSLSMGLPDKNSDIDLVIITKKNRLWTCRFFLTGVFSILGHKRIKNKKAAPEKFCLSYFIDLGFANLEKQKINNDPLFTHWLATLKPIIGGKSVEYFYSQNAWLIKHFPNLKIDLNNDTRIKPLSLCAFIVEKIITLFGEKLENYLFKIQKKKIKAKNKKDTLLAQKNVCRLLQPDGYRTKFAKKFEKELKKLIYKTQGAKNPPERLTSFGRTGNNQIKFKL